jgi:RNA methyltransferase, TrmH family
MYETGQKITSIRNPRIKEAVRLRERKARKETNSFLIEGYRELSRAIGAGRLIDTIFFCPQFFLGENERHLLQAAQVEKILCSPDVFEKISYRDRPDGLLGIAKQVHRRISEYNSPSFPTFLLIAESIEKPGNLGSILRSCDAAGVQAVFVCDPTTDIYNPNVIRASVGTVFTVPIYEGTTQEALDFLHKNEIFSVAATPDAKIEYTEADLLLPLALVVGSEQYGLSEPWRKKADYPVRIPMLGIADSLNVASATSLLIYETLRQRRLSR